jgi:hypothetical protein
MGRKKHLKNMSPNEFLVHLVEDIDHNVVDTWLLLYAAQLGMHQAMKDAQKAKKDDVMGFISVEYTKETLRKWLQMYDEWNSK